MIALTFFVAFTGSMVAAAIITSAFIIDTALTGIRVRLLDIHVGLQDIDDSLQELVSVTRGDWRKVAASTPPTPHPGEAEKTGRERNAA